MKMVRPWWIDRARARAGDRNAAGGDGVRAVPDGAASASGGARDGADDRAVVRSRCGTITQAAFDGVAPDSAHGPERVARPHQPCVSARSAERLAAMAGTGADDGTSPGTGDRAVTLVGSRPARRMLRWLGPGVTLVGERERSWASAAFVGARHTLELAVAPGLALADRARLDERLAGLADAELDLPDAFVADAERLATQKVAGSDRIVIELLVIEQR